MKINSSLFLKLVSPVTFVLISSPCEATSRIRGKPNTQQHDSIMINDNDSSPNEPEYEVRRKTEETEPSRKIFAYYGRPPPEAFPLGLCEGDCKDDTECEAGLYCFQRGRNEPIPGCIGGERDNSRTDYCTDTISTMSPSEMPSTIPSANPTALLSASPTEVSRDIFAYYGRPPPEAFPLGLCQGDCNDDTECEEGLYCFQRGPNTPVPGCIGGERDNSRTDYCTDTVPKPPSPAPTISPSSVPTSSSAPSTSPSSFPTPTPGHIFAYPGGPPSEAYPLQQCQGDCLWHEDCDEGMFCFQRDPYEAVPGCTGGENDATTTDYCTYIAPVVAPAVPPTTDNFRIKMYWDNYYWQEEDFDRVWCMQCKDGCQEGEVMFLHYCAWDSARFEFLEVSTDTIQIKVIDTDLCLERVESLTSLEICDIGNPLQHWTSAQGSYDGDFFEFTQFYNGEDHCVTTHHHPKYGEIIELFPCTVARFDTTSYWNKF